MAKPSLTSDEQSAGRTIGLKMSLRNLRSILLEMRKYARIRMDSSRRIRIRMNSDIGLVEALRTIISYVRGNVLHIDTQASGMLLEIFMTAGEMPIQDPGFARLGSIDAAQIGKLDPNAFNTHELSSANWMIMSSHTVNVSLREDVGT